MNEAETAEDEEMLDEIDPQVLEQITLAGARFKMIVEASILYGRAVMSTTRVRAARYVGASAFLLIAGCGQLPERALVLDPALVERAQSIEKFDPKKVESEPERPIEEFESAIRPSETVGLAGATAASEDSTESDGTASDSNVSEATASEAMEVKPLGSVESETASPTESGDAPKATESAQKVEDKPKSVVLASEQPASENDADPEPQIWDLQIDEVRREVLANNLQIQVALVNPAISETVVNEADAACESVFSAAVDQDRTTSKIQIPGINVDTETESGTYTYGISVPLRTGATITAAGW